MTVVGSEARITVRVEINDIDHAPTLEPGGLGSSSGRGRNSTLDEEPRILVAPGTEQRTSLIVPHVDAPLLQRGFLGEEP
jgi:hypothetical protein